MLGSLFAPHYFPVDDSRYLTGNFNAHMASCLLLQADEAMWAGDKEAEGRLKGLLTSENPDDRDQRHRSNQNGESCSCDHDIQ